MIDQIEARTRASKGEQYYPVAATAVVLVGALCDSLGVSKPMRGPISPSDKNSLFASPRLSPQGATQGGTQGATQGGALGALGALGKARVMQGGGVGLFDAMVGASEEEEAAEDAALLDGTLAELYETRRKGVAGQVLGGTSKREMKR